MSVLVALLALLAFSSAELAPLLESNGEVIPGSYIVVYKDEVPADVFAKDVLLAVQQFEVSHQYSTVMKGYAAKLNDTHLAAVRSNPFVSYVEVDQVMSAFACTNPSPVNTWGLNRICQQATYVADDTYQYNTQAGTGVTAYIIDTGILTSHVDFAGRATFGWKAEVLWTNGDNNGHGTHVASTVVGNSWGVAKGAKAVAVKVLGDDGRGSTSGVIGGVDWSTSEVGKKGEKGVINMSLGGGFSAALNFAVNSAVSKNVVVVVAAGNEDTDACNGSPSSAGDVITVGSTEEGASYKDVRSYFSNYGDCLDIFAPGTSITGAWIGVSNTATRTISGTSMASPHVAGIACLLRSEHAGQTAVQINKHLTDTATSGVINLACKMGTSCSRSPNLMAWNGCHH